MALQPIAGTPFSVDSATGQRVLTGGVMPYDPNARITPIMANGSGGPNWADVVGVANQSALQWYSTVTQKPVAPGAPGSMMQNVFGTDFRGGPTVLGQTASPIGVVLVIAVVVVGLVLIARR